MRLIKLFLVIFVMIFGAAFAVLNSNPVEVNYYFGHQEIALSLVLTLVLGLGVILGVLSTMARIIRLKHEIQTLKRGADLVSKEVNNLRALPLKE
ncbi:MAG: lipopolysaccharide assembly protein LapA domain-containing protein [Candidatus Thiodiazotropha sp.]